jgi:signal transduction histidine kinase
VTAAVARSDGTSGAGRSLLLVEDNAADAELVTILLQGTRYVVTPVDTIARAEALLVDRTFHVVLLDLHVPDAAPLEAVRRVSARSGGAAVLAITHSNADLAMDCLSAGLQDFIRKSGMTTATLVRALDHAEVRARASEVARRLELAERRATLGAIASYVGHEINNQVSLILSGLELASNDLRSIRSFLGGEQLRVVDQVLGYIDDRIETAERCGNIVRQLKLLGTPQESAAPIAHVAAVVQRCVRTMDPLLSRNAHVALDLEPCPPAAIEEHKLAQVLVNLLRNAAEAIEGASEHRITVRLREVAGQVVVAVSDTGPGIPAERMASLFRPFYSSKPGGTGVGLAVCAEIVAAAGGRITAESPSGAGATFSVTLPRARGATPPARKAPISDAPPRRLRVLFVEDDATLRRSVTMLLRRHHEVLEARDGREALEILAKPPPPDVIVCDLMMRGMDGVELYEIVCRDHPQLRNRFAFLTGGAFTDAARKLVDSQQVVVLQKPCSYRTLSAEIVRLGQGAPPDA